MNFSFVDPWHLFLPRQAGHVIAFSGSGGKTSLLLEVATLYRSEGVPVLLTTTTRTEPLAGLPVADAADAQAVVRLAEEPVFCLRSAESDDGKWIGLPPEQVDELGAAYPDRVVLVEVDGAAKMPLKRYRAGEPVWPSRTSLAIPVMGLSALEERAGDVVFRLDDAESPVLEGVGPRTRWTWDHFEALLTGEGGYLDRIPADVPVALALGHMGDLADSIGLFAFMDRAMTHPRVRIAVLCETGDEQPSFRTVCRMDEADADRGVEGGET